MPRQNASFVWRKFWHWRPEWWHPPSDRFAAIVAVFTAVLAIVSSCQWHEMKLAYGPLKDSADAAKKSAEATERSSIAGRAYIFARYEQPDEKDLFPKIVAQNGEKIFINVTMRFSIHNFGKTPAVITKLETHLFVSNTDRFFTVDNAPNPLAVTSKTLMEESCQPALALNGSLYFGKEDLGSTRVTIPANWDSGAIEQNFVVSRPVAMTKDAKFTRHGAWFYCRSTYKDIFNIERHTTMYFGMYGAAVEYPRNGEFNEWD